MKQEPYVPARLLAREWGITAPYLIAQGKTPK